MSLYNQIISVYPEISIEEFDPQRGTIELRNDSDGKGDYIAKWEYTNPIPEGLTVGKPKK